MQSLSAYKRWLRVGKEPNRMQNQNCPELKACPWCGSHKVQVGCIVGKPQHQPPLSPPDEREQWRVECLDCHSQTDHHHSKDSAVQYWNGRLGDEGLKPCPICQALSGQIQRSGLEAYVKCSVCNTHGPHNMEGDTVKAQKAWNTRQST